MAQTLHDTYGYSYDNLKVLLGGWNAWNEAHATDPAGYPEGGTSATPQAAGTSAPGAPTSNTTVNSTVTPVPIGVGTVIINVGGAGQTPQVVTPGAPVSAPAPSP